ncbi:unnamed protein product [Prorocentrum cordatum]|uniref:Exocyst complex component Sec6 n=1 Tax=Prorocentrum cordatum TaxID=2364126 RepID=A0ABN9Y9G1_9DINO|nr:unnamed protein product [Polarella glacialis]
MPGAASKMKKDVPAASQQPSSRVKVNAKKGTPFDSKGKPTKGSKKDKETSPAEPENAWAHAPPHTCQACVQTTHDIDRDSDPSNKYFLRWHKTWMNAAGILLPGGSECSRCFDTRRRYFDETFTSLMQKRQENQDLDNHYYDLRRDRASGGTKFKDQQKMKVDQWVSKRKEEFDEDFIEGTWMELYAFADQRRIQGFKNEDDLVEVIKSKWPHFRVAFNKAGILGVADTVSLHKSERHASKAMNEEAFENARLKKFGDKAARSGKQRRSAADATLEAATDLIAVADEKWTFKLHWESKLRQRDFSAFMARLNTHGRKVGNVVGNIEAADLSRKVFDIQEVIEKRHGLFERIRNDFVNLVIHSLSCDDQDALIDAPLEVLGMIITSEMSTAINKMGALMDQNSDVLRAFGIVADAAFRKDCFSIGLLAKAGDLAEECQKGLVLHLAERMWKVTDVHWVIQCGQQLLETLGEGAIVDADKIDMKGGPIQGGSWYPKPKVDLCCLILLARCLQSEHSAKKLSRYEIAMCCSMVSNKSKLSPRLRAHFRQICGAAVQLGRSAWEAMVKIHGERQGQAEKCKSLDLKEAGALTDRMAAATSPASCHEVICDAFNDNYSMIDALGAMSGDGISDAGVSPNAEIDGAVRDMLAQVLRCTDVYLQSCNIVGACMAKVNEIIHGARGVLPTEPDDDSDDPGDDAAWLLGAIQLAGCLMVKPPDVLTYLSGKLTIFLDVYKAIVATTGKDATSFQDSLGAIATCIEKEQLMKDRTKAASTTTWGHDNGKILATLAAQFHETVNTSEITMSFMTSVVGRDVKRARDVMALIDDGKLLPPGAMELAKGAATTQLVQEAREKLANGKPAGGLLELSNMLHDAHAAQIKHPKLFTQSADFDDMLKTVRDEWEKLHNNFIIKSKSFEVLSDFIKESSPVKEAVQLWDCSKAPWLVSESMDMSGMMKKIDQLVTHVPSWRNTLETMIPLLTFTSAPHVDAAKQFLQVVVGSQAEMKEAVELAAINVVASAVLKRSLDAGAVHKEAKGAKDPVSQAVGYATKFLGVPVESLPTELRSKLNVPEAEAPKDAAGGPEAAPTTAAAASTTAAGGLKKKKKPS